MKRGGVARLQHFVGASACVAIVILLAPAQAAQQDGISAKAPTRYRYLEQMFYSDIRPAAPDQQLSQALEKKSEAEAAYIQGLILEDEGDFEEALATYTHSLQFDPGGNPQLAVRVAHEYGKRGEVATGIDILKDLAKARPNEPTAYLNLTYFYLRQLKKPELAVKFAEQAVKVAPDNYVGYQTLFEVYLALKRKTDAEATIERAQKLNSKDPGFWLSLVDLSIRLYRNDNGNFAPNKATAVEPLLQKAVSLAGNDGGVYSKAGDSYVLMNQVSSAIPLYVKALELNQGNAEDRYKLAQSFLKTGHRDEAIRTLEEMVKANPLKFEIYEFLARLYEDSGSLERALANYQQALLLAPNQPDNYLHTAETQLQLKKYDDAISTLEDARRRFPIPQITYSLAIALSTAKRHNDALPVYEAALQEARSAQEDLIDATFYFNYAVSAEQAGLIDKAAALLKKSIELDPSKAAQAYNYLGFMWVDRNMNLDEAGSFIKKALELDPENGAYIDSLGWYYYRKTEFGKALTELLHAADVLKPEDPVVFEHIGDTYQAVGNTAQALVYWQKAAHLDPQNSALAAKIDQSKAKLTANPSNSPVHAPTPQPSSSPESAPPPKPSATP